MQKKIMGVIGIGTVLALGACHSTPRETVLETFKNAPIPKWVSSPRTEKIEEEAKEFKIFVETKTVPWSDKGWSFVDNPLRKACVAAEADEEKALPGGSVYAGITKQNMFWVKAKGADGKVVLHASCEVTWKKNVPS